MFLIPSEKPIPFGNFQFFFDTRKDILLPILKVGQEEI